jgi:hypothetical protein
LQVEVSRKASQLIDDEQIPGWKCFVDIVPVLRCDFAIFAALRVIKRARNIHAKTQRKQSRKEDKPAFLRSREGTKTRRVFA